MSRTSPLPEPDGLLPLDKPVGPTSHDMVAVARRSLGLRRVGHTGTLDPFASGLLLLCVGRSTRLAEYLSGFSKSYTAVARLGETTETDDPEGGAVHRSDAWNGLGFDDVAGALASFHGETLQRPPSYSAKKVRGRAAHRRVRAGESVALAPVPVTIHEIELEALELPDVRFRLRCSTGTYVRAVARDLGERLGTGAHLVELRREAIGPFRVDAALGPGDLEDPAAVADALISPLEAVGHLPLVEVGDEEALRITAGQALSTNTHPGAERAGDVAVAAGGRLLAVAVSDGAWLRPRKVFPLE